MKALVIEDNLDQQELCRAALESVGFEVSTADNSVDAYKLIEKELWSLITIDIKLKGHSGLDILNRLKESTTTVDIPVMMISAFTDSAIQYEALHIGAIDYIVKPYDLELMGVRAKIYAERYQNQIYKTNDMQAAAFLQKKFLTPKDKMANAFAPIGVDVVIYNKASDQISGDFYCYKEIKNHNSTGFFFADSCGHGLAAGLLSMRVISFIEAVISPARHPSEMLDYINSDLCDVIPSNLFVAASYTIFTHNSLIFSNSGQPSPLIFKDQKVEELSILGPALGMVAGTIFADKEIPFLEGDRILIYTDGAIEIENQAGEQFGTKRFIDLCTKYQNESPEQMVEIIIKEMTKFHGSMNFEDDLTLSLFIRKSA